MKKKNSKKVLVAMSGGVDSSLAAKLLVDQGYQVTGVFLRFWQDKGQENLASRSKAYKDAQAVAQKIAIKLLTFNWQAEFKKSVVDYFLQAYQAGLTPNPCVACNQRIKLGGLIKKARELGYDYVASGHYLKLLKKDKEIRVYKAKDKLKDQSYFLYTLKPGQLKKLLFPLANYSKNNVRQLAKKFALPTAIKSDSQDICFLAGPHNNFLKKHLKLKTGKIKEMDSNKVIGQHLGLPLYTIGQRRGINIGGTGPYYVAKLDYENNILWVVNTWNDKLLYHSSFTVKAVNWLGSVKPSLPLKTQVVIRYGHPAINCLVEKSQKASQLIVNLNEKTRAITPGQSAVFYSDNRLLGGGIIDRYL